MRLIDAPILKFYRLVIGDKDKVSFEEAGIKNLTTSIQTEKGTLLMLAGYSDQDGVNNYVVECYKSPESLQKHQNSPQFKNYQAVAKGTVQEKDSFDLTPQIILTKEEPSQFVKDNELYVQMNKYTLVDEDLEKFAKEVKRETDHILINEEDYVGTIAGSFFDVENEWRVFTIFKNKQAYKRHLKGQWHQMFDENTREMIYSQSSIPLHTYCLVDQGELIYRKQ